MSVVHITVYPTMSPNHAPILVLEAAVLHLLPCANQALCVSRQEPSMIRSNINV